MSDKLTVYSFRRCPFAMRVRLTLHEKGLPFDVQEEDLKHFSEALRRLHPEAKVPVLVHGTTVIYESAIITEYLEDAFPATPRLLPEKASERAEVRLWTYWCNQHFKGQVDRLKYGTSRFSAAECEGVEDRVQVHIEKLDQRLQASRWLVGDAFSLADIHVFPFVRQLRRVTPTPSFLAAYPALAAWAETIAARPAFLRTLEK